MLDSESIPLKIPDRFCDIGFCGIEAGAGFGIGSSSVKKLFFIDIHDRSSFGRAFPPFQNRKNTHRMMIN